MFGLGGIPNFQMPNFDASALQMPSMNIPASAFDLPKPPNLQEFMSGGMGPLGEMAPGIGQNALDLPEMPPMEHHMALKSMQAAHQQERTEFAEGFKNELMHKVEKVFQNFHYEYDSGGEPRLVEGAETENQREVRLQWEGQKKDNIKSRQQGELDAIQNEVAKIIDELKANPAMTQDPEANAARQKKLKELEAREKTVKAKHDQELFKELYGHLPDPKTINYYSEQVLVSEETVTDTTESTVAVDELLSTAPPETSDPNAADTTAATTTDPNATDTATATDPNAADTATDTTNTDTAADTNTEPATVTSTDTNTQTTTVYENVTRADLSNSRPIDGFIDSKFSEFRAMEARHQNVEQNSEAGQAIAAYQKEMEAFVKKQYEMLAAVRANQSTMFSPDSYYDMDFFSPDKYFDAAGGEG